MVKAKPANLNNTDPASELSSLLEGLKAEERRSLETLHLTAYENRPSKLAHSFLSSNLSFRQHEGTLDEHDMEDVVRHGAFIFMGLPGVYALESKAREAAQKMFHAAISDFRPTSGLHALLCTLATATKPGDTIYTIDPMNGGHSASRHMIASLGRKSEYIPWSNSELTVDLDAFADAVKKIPPQAIILEHGTPLFNIPLSSMREIVGDDVTIIYDGSHTLGLIAGGVFQDPLREGCDILQGNLHKTFPGPQKAIINFKNREEGLRISAGLSKGFVSNQHTHHAIAAYITALEMEAFGADYARQMIKNASALGTALAEYGFDMVSRRGEFTNSHQLLIQGDADEIDEKCRRLFACGISTNARYSFGRKVIRIGVQEVTRQGMKTDDMKEIAGFFHDALIKNTDVEKIKKRVIGFNSRYANIAFSFDGEFYRK